MVRIQFWFTSRVPRLPPALAPSALGAVLCPREAVVEPWLVPLAFAESLFASVTQSRQTFADGAGVVVLEIGR